ncbi:sulfite exporter TauE/SafE family protein [Roseicyclus sp. F158]|uniref:Probable membrane transporter protein n=1 Tax=Tropicimonas omnivorans TaxID=3075590 RepID=A0ABU3DD77_9RHOB|nr:sulfite exporter TauE/SafE family protein [Roseicyclus sp. F158]MDT0681647.1 sulfite exporter TauE/SafE family protein [Roseicyclus sp. F158]
MTGLLDLVPLPLLVLAASIAVGAGVVKGATGFAFPMIMISTLGSFLPPQIALAALIVPTVVTNGFQAFREGPAAAWDAVRAHWLFVLVVSICLILSAQLVGLLDPRVIFAAIGVPITLFAIFQLGGWRLRITPGSKRKVEIGAAAFAGAVGGFSGVWGPPTVAYLTALDTPKTEAVRTQGVIFGLSSILLLLAHMNSGVLNPQTWPLSLAMVVPALLGLKIGQGLQDSMDQVRFRRFTLIVLVVAGLNLIRRALAG